MRTSFDPDEARLVKPVVDAIRRSLTRNSYSSHNDPSINATNRSWVHSQQNTPGPPPSPPLPIQISLQTHAQRLRPLPNPHAQAARQHHPSVLYTVNPSEPLDSEEEDQQRIDNIRFGLQKAGPSKLRKPPVNSVHNIKDKKPTVLGGLAKSIRNIPKIIGYGPGKGVTSKRRRALETDGEGTSTSDTCLTTGSTLPQYTSNPPTPIVAPIPSRPHHYAHQPMGMQIPTTVPVLGSSPLPEVVRLDDVRRRRPDFRIMPPSINIARSKTTHFFPGTTNNTDASSSASNTAERTSNHHTPTPSPPLARQTSTNGPPGRLSYVGSEQVIRPTSFHGGSQAPHIEISTSITRMGTPASYLSYVSQPTAVPSTVPFHVNRSSSQLQFQRSNQSHHQQHQPTSPPQHQPPSTSPIESSERIQSPISAHPQPTTDYLKMAHSPPHSLQHHTTSFNNLTSAADHSSSGVTSFSLDPSFSNTSSLIERFFKTLYYMPWIAYERITVDYLPGKVGRVHGHALSRETSVKGVERRRRGGGDKRRKETRDKYRERWRRKQRKTRVDRGDGDEKIASWYKGVPSRSKKTCAELDLLSSDLGLQSSSTTTTTGAAIGLGLEILPADAASPRSPLAATVTAPVKERERRQRDRKENVGDKQKRTSHSRHHYHRQDPHNRHRGKRRRRIGSVGSPDNDEDEILNQSPSPLIPAVYPFYYPPYPYPYPYTFTIPSPSGPQTQSQSQPQPLSSPSKTPNERTQSRNQRGPRSMPSRANQGQSSLSHPVFYSPGIPHPGYTGPAHAYQPMIAPSTTTMMAPQVYLLHSTSHGQLEPLSLLSRSGPVQNGSGVVDGGRGGSGGGSGPEVLLDAADSGQQ